MLLVTDCCTSVVVNCCMSRTSPPRARPSGDPASEANVVPMADEHLRQRVTQEKNIGSCPPEEKHSPTREVCCTTFKDTKNYVSPLHDHIADRMIGMQVMWSLAFLSGWADILCVQRYFAFATMLTGNSIYTAQSASKSCWYNTLVREQFIWRQTWIQLTQRGSTGVRTCGCILRHGHAHLSSGGLLDEKASSG